MMGRQSRSEALFYYFRLEDQIPETHLLRPSRVNGCLQLHRCPTSNCHRRGLHPRLWSRQVRQASSQAPPSLDVGRESVGPMFLLAVSMQYKLAALETGFHFPYVVRVVSLRSVHCLTDIILAHRRCLLGTANEPKLALRDIPFLQPYVHEVILSPPSRSEVNHERTSRSSV